MHIKSLIAQSVSGVRSYRRSSTMAARGVLKLPSSISGEELASILTSDSDNDIAVIDVRDHDHIGGNIAISRHVPSQTLDVALPELVRTLKYKKQVVFHCMLSQQRGPKAARQYMEEREKTVRRDGPDTWPEQEVFVLVGGFDRWQQLYGNDPKLTANYAEDIFKSLW